MTGNNSGATAVNMVVRHWQIIVAVIGIVWVGGADAQQLNTARADITKAQTDIATTREAYAHLSGEIGEVKGRLDTLTLILRPAPPNGTQP